jgi:hypothetical protein
MIYLDVLIGFSLVMLVFASGVSVVTTMIKRVRNIKGRALTAPLRDEITSAWKRLGNTAEAVDAETQKALDACQAALVGPDLGLRTLAIANARQILEKLKGLGGKELSDDKKKRWDSAIDQVDGDWDRIVGRLADAYELRTRRWVVGISLGVVLLFNVDAIRMLQILSVSPDARGKLVQVAAKVHDQGPPAVPEGDFKAAYDVLNDWQKGNLAAMASTGLPIGWGKVSLYVVDAPSGVRHDCLVGETCEGTMARLPSFSIWFFRLIGLIIGAGLVAQGAPFWYSVVDTALGIKKKLPPPDDTAGSDLDDAQERLNKIVIRAEAWANALGPAKGPAAGAEPPRPT